MVECQKCLDPTAFGLFLVATVSLPLAVLQLWQPAGFSDLPGLQFFTVMGILAIITALLAYKSDSNFGFIVFGLVGAAVLLTGLQMGFMENITFGVIFLLALIWSIWAKTPKTLSLILVTTTLIFLFVGFWLYDGSDWWHWLIGIAALGNFIFAIFLAYALATEKLPVI